MVTDLYFKETDFNRHLVNIKEWFFARGYPEKMVKEQMKRVVFGKTDKTREDLTKGVPFVVTFHPKLTFLAKKIKLLSKYLYIDLEVKAVFTPTPTSFVLLEKSKTTM